ncbi:glycine betaine transporter [Cyclobacterium lianum]|uniref:Glycine betaine transporter n=1 Tax=Cyclobacterium lianum TaxID=388280 RepID=A0A1M7LD44_9BACT|nr:BCCT family transporter [Cyclobacterium lianum]SHM75523.1 glycine betaine transporter [Cyclobacterium lianum]
MPTNKPTFLVSIAACLIFLFLAFSIPVEFKVWIQDTAARTLDYFGGYYLFLGLAIVLALLSIAVSPLGNTRLGDGPVAYGWFSWVAMLYSTGMGAGLMLRAVQEPVYYYTQAPRPSVLDPDIFALEYTFFHWGLTPWAFYGMFGLIIGYLVYGKGRLMLSSSVLAGRFQKPWLSVPIDVITIISTLFGVVGAVGLGSRQLLAGFRELFGLLDVNYTNNAWVVVFLGSLATLSAFTGLSQGIRNLSRFNIALALFLMLFTWFSGDLFGVFVTFFLALTSYLQDFLPMSLNIGSMKVEQDFLMDWTYFYWAFWLSWAPFTGVFIARISRGRTFREFILGVLLVPSLGTFFWFAVFGSQAFALIGDPETYAGQFDSLYGSIFVFFDSLPMAGIIKSLGLLLVFTFLITSIDSAIYVLGMFADNGNMEPRKRNLLGWGLILVLFTVATIFVGREQLLESISQLLVLMALPFSWVYLLMISSFLYILYRSK